MMMVVVPAELFLTQPPRPRVANIKTQKIYTSRHRVAVHSLSEKGHTVFISYSSSFRILFDQRRKFKINRREAMETSI